MNEKNSNEKKNKLSLKGLVSGDKGRNILIIVGIVALGLIFLSTQFSSDSKPETKSDFSTEQYKDTLSAEILSMVESIEGSGKAKILLTLENSYEYIYLDDDETLQKIIEPQIRGVIVACEGAKSEVICEQIRELLKTALNIPGSKVCVKKLK